MKTIVITGATRGFGLAASRACLEAGANVVISSEDLTDVRATEQTLGHRDELYGTKCDVTNPGDVERLIDLTVRHFGKVDVFINNAGAEGVLGKTADVPIARGRRVIATDLLGTYHGSVCALRQLERQGDGRLINVVGHSMRGTAPYSNLHGATKAWIAAFTANARLEYAKSGVEVGTYDPGICFSRFTRDVTVITGEESRVASVRWLLRAIGAPPEVPARELAQLALSAHPLPAATHNMRFRVLLSRAFVRLVLRREPPFDTSNLVAHVIPAERSLLSN